MDFLKVLEESISNIVSKHKSGQWQAVKRVVDHLKENGFPASQNKENLIKGLNKIINEEGPDLEQQLVDMVTYTSRTAIKLTKFQASNLRKIRTAIDEAKVHKICSHENIAMTGSIHGGGFTPSRPLPEVICRDCGANVTFYSGNPEIYRDDYGVKIERDGLEALKKWLVSESRKSFAYGEDVVKDTQSVLARCTLWEGKLPFKIVNPTIFSARSGK